MIYVLSRKKLWNNFWILIFWQILEILHLVLVSEAAAAVELSSPKGLTSFKFFFVLDYAVLSAY